MYEKRKNFLFLIFVEAGEVNFPLKMSTAMILEFHFQPFMKDLHPHSPQQ